MSILVIGESCTDCTVTCKVERLCPEGPIPVANPIRTTESFGMAANVRANLLSLGATDVTLLSQTYDIIKTRYVDEQSGYLLLRVDEHDKADRVERELLEVKIGYGWDAIVISSYDKGFLHDDDIRLIAESAKKRGIPTFLDTKRALGEFSKDITFVKINRKEYDHNVKTIGTPADWCQNLIVTLGAGGSWWVNKDIHVPTIEVPVADVTGSGDVHLAAFTLKYLQNGGNVYTALEYANRAASIGASKRGVVAVQASEVEA